MNPPGALSPTGGEIRRQS